MSLLLPSIKKPRHFGPGLSPAAARRNRRSPGAERLQTSYRARKGNVSHPSQFFSPAIYKSEVRSLTNAVALQHTVRVGWDRDDGEDSRRLAFDPSVALPGERRRQTPRLERQEAFRAPQPWDISDTDVVINDAELYRLGILYDDEGSEHMRGSGFCLDAIVHKEPVYSIRGAKRAKKAHGRRLPLKQEDLHLSVELLSTYLGDDATIARFFAPMGDEGPARLYHDDCGGTSQQQNSSTLRNASAEPLSIIYELAESSTHSLALAPTEGDFPDLISDTEEEGHEECEDIPGSGDWALVLDPDNDSGQLSWDTAWFDTNADVIADGHEETAGPVGGAWVFLAGDDS
ncbi:hypothetical protein F5B21DRAFT_12534 [Xylaria acuta]|nr:hypothetical protein F5B21DRAFT_12534 [Xylaria acuta]